VQEFIDRHQLTFLNKRDPDGSIFASFNVSSQPAWVFQNPKGIREVVQGAMSQDDLEASLTKLAG